MNEENPARIFRLTDSTSDCELHRDHSLVKQTVLQRRFFAIKAVMGCDVG
jgi:hypothetical protein